jgi:hypothetical protein
MVMIILSELVLKHATQRGTNLGANAVKTNCIYWVMHIYIFQLSNSRDLASGPSSDDGPLAT